METVASRLNSKDKVVDEEVELDDEMGQTTGSAGTMVNQTSSRPWRVQVHPTTLSLACMKQERGALVSDHLELMLLSYMRQSCPLCCYMLD